MSDLRIVPWRAEHTAALDTVLEPPDELTGQVRGRHGRDVVSPQWARTVVAEDAGRPVGVATVFVSRWHPHRLWVAVEVAPADRRRGVGTVLLDAARGLAQQDGRPLRAKVFAESPGAAFAEAHNFRSLQRSRTFRLDRQPERTAPGRFRVDDAAAPDSVARAFLNFYVRIHSWDPPGSITVADVRTVHVDDASATLLVRAEDGSASAVGCLYDDPDRVFLSGGVTEAGAGARAAARTLLEAAVAFAANRGRKLFVEADDAATEMVAELVALDAPVVDEVEVVADR